MKARDKRIKEMGQDEPEIDDKLLSLILTILIIKLFGNEK